MGTPRLTLLNGLRSLRASLCTLSLPLPSVLVVIVPEGQTSEQGEPALLHVGKQPLGPGPALYTVQAHGPCPQSETLSRAKRIPRTSNHAAWNCSIKGEKLRASLRTVSKSSRVLDYKSTGFS